MSIEAGAIIVICAVFLGAACAMQAGRVRDLKKDLERAHEDIKKLRMGLFISMKDRY